MRRKSSAPQIAGIELVEQVPEVQVPPVQHDCPVPPQVAGSADVGGSGGKPHCMLTPVRVRPS